MEEGEERRWVSGKLILCKTLFLHRVGKVFLKTRGGKHDEEKKKFLDN
jgi:hypothetical protein